MWSVEGQCIKKQNNGEPLKMWGQLKRFKKISFRFMKVEQIFLCHMFPGPGADSGLGVASFLRV